MYCLAMLLKNRSERRARSATCFYAGQLEISPVILFLDSLDSHRYFLLVFFLGLKNLFSSFLNSGMFLQRLDLIHERGNLYQFMGEKYHAR
mmetsp:Transcript_27779/g.108987  ORF Transcript_27779/g.108987 Transcript_27779/m.108987 type:complete len:91 (-) Transcript_27779:1257-1529(-)